MPQHVKDTEAFTLVELSIVLVIIGLLVGGVLVGQDLIKAAETRSTVSQIEKIKTAATTFRLKHNCLPGDCNSATLQGLGTVSGAGDNGDGNGIINGNAYGGTQREGYNFWYHLLRANLIEGNYEGYPGDGIDVTTLAIPGRYFPQTSIGGGMWVSNGMLYPSSSFNIKSSIWMIDRMEGTTASDAVYYGNWTPYQAYQVDSKMDDGLPGTGSMKASYTAQSDILIEYDLAHLDSVGPGGATSNYCVANNTTPASYNTLNTSRHPDTLCIMQIFAGF